MTQVMAEIRLVPEENQKRSAINGGVNVMPMPPMKAPASTTLISAAFAEQLPHIRGVNVSETMPLAKMEMMMVTENSWKIRPINPFISTSGRNTAASEIVIDRIVKLISRAPFNVAVQRRLVITLPSAGRGRSQETRSHRPRVEPDR